MCVYNMYIYIFKVREGQGKGIDVYDKGLGYFEGNEIAHNAMDGIVIKTSAAPTSPLYIS